MEPLSILIIGFLLGIKHAFDADHLVAVSTLLTHNRSAWRTIRLGLWWGVGHTLTLVLVGFTVLTLKLDIPPAVSLSMECLAGAMLIALGLTTLFDCWCRRLHVHRHVHAETVHLHFHTHATHAGHQHGHRIPTGWNPIVVGMVHGLAGSAALMLLVVASSPSVMTGLAYILTFGCGSILGMGAVRVLMSACFSLASPTTQGLSPSVHVAVGGASLVMGLWIIFEVGFVSGLFLT